MKIGARFTLSLQSSQAIDAHRAKMMQKMQAGSVAELVGSDVLEVHLPGLSGCLSAPVEIHIVKEGIRDYTDRWIAYVPWPERDQIRLVYNVM